MQITNTHKTIFVVALVAVAAYLLLGRKAMKKVEAIVNPLEGKSIYNPEIPETEGHVWTLVEGKWYRPSGGSLGWVDLPAKKEQNILPKTAYTREDFLKYPISGEMDYTKLPQFS